MNAEFLELTRKYPNDQDLGEYLRHEYVNDLNANPIIVRMVRETPNDFTLGKFVRAFILNS
jgi:predicted phage tail protein